MINRIKHLLDFFKRSLWLIPSLMTLGGLLVGISLNYIDSFLVKGENPYFGFDWNIESEGVRALFASVCAAIITAMTTILSITLLIFTVLANQYGAHVLRVFKIRTFSKFVIGWFGAVYMYMIYHVYTITINDEGESIPTISIIFGALFTVSTIFLLILYIHFLVRQIQVGTVVYEIFSDLKQTILSMEPLETVSDKALVRREFSINSECFVTSPSAGYLQTVDKKSLKKLAEDENISLYVPVRAGHFVISGDVLAYIKGKKELDDSFADKVRACFLSGEQRLPVNDLECNLDTLIEMILRALSPGINDLVVANNCIDYVGETIVLLAERQFPDTDHYNDEGKLLLACKEFTFEGYMDAALNPIRQYAVGHCFVVVRLLDILIKVTRINRNPLYQKSVNRHFKAYYEEALKRHEQEIDLESIKSRNELFHDCLANKMFKGSLKEG